MNYYHSRDLFEQEIKKYILEVFKALSKAINIDDIVVSFQDKNQHPPKFNKGKMYIYSFWLETETAPLKIGKAGPNSIARYTSHHYNMNSSNSCLAKRIAEDNAFKDKYGINKNIGSEQLNRWIRENCYRINIEMPYDIENGFDLYTLELVEAILHNLFPPIYEGTTNQQARKEKV